MVRRYSPGVGAPCVVDDAGAGIEHAAQDLPVAIYAAFLGGTGNDCETVGGEGVVVAIGSEDKTWVVKVNATPALGGGGSVGGVVLAGYGPRKRPRGVGERI